MTGANLIAETNQYLMFGLPHSHLSQIVPFFKIVEHERSEHGKRAIISDCSISHTSAFPSSLLPPPTMSFADCGRAALEEVFLKITRQANAEESRLVQDPWTKVGDLLSGNDHSDDRAK
jgi:hypothetical protein